MKIEYNGYTAELQVNSTNWSSVLEGLGHTVTVVIKAPHIKNIQDLPVDEELIQTLFAEWFAQKIDSITGFGESE